MSYLITMCQFKVYTYFNIVCHECYGKTLYLFHKICEEKKALKTLHGYAQSKVIQMYIIMVCNITTSDMVYIRRTLPAFCSGVVGLIPV